MSFDEITTEELLAKLSPAGRRQFLDKMLALLSFTFLNLKCGSASSRAVPLMLNFVSAPRYAACRRQPCPSTRCQMN